MQPMHNSPALRKLLRERRTCRLHVLVRIDVLVERNDDLSATPLDAIKVRDWTLQQLWFTIRAGLLTDGAAPIPHATDR
jgi:hypothetical protein